MAFTVVNSVRASKEDIPGILLDVQRMGIDAVRHQPGFRLARLMVAEDVTEAVLVMEWESREHFVAYRQTEMGRHLVETAMRLHPHIAFYEVVASFDAEPGS